MHPLLRRRCSGGPALQAARSRTAAVADRPCGNAWLQGTGRRPPQAGGGGRRCPRGGAAGRWTAAQGTARTGGWRRAACTLEGALGVQLQTLEVRSPDEFESAFATMTREHAEVLLVLGDPLTLTYRIWMVDLV